MLAAPQRGPYNRRPPQLRPAMTRSTPLPPSRRPRRPWAVLALWLAYSLGALGWAAMHNPPGDLCIAPPAAATRSTP